jgi:hypothetical protein
VVGRLDTHDHTDVAGSTPRGLYRSTKRTLVPTTKSMRQRSEDGLNLVAGEPQAEQEKAPPVAGGAVRQSTHTANMDFTVARMPDNSGSSS